MILSLLSRLLMLSSPTARAIIVRTAIWLVYACTPCTGKGSRNQNTVKTFLYLECCTHALPHAPPIHPRTVKAYSMDM